MVTLFRLICVFLLGSQCYAWNAQGHALVAQIALSQLTPDELVQLERYNTAFKMGYQPKQLTQAAVWLDWLHCQETWCRDFRYYHYIDYPLSFDGTRTQPPRPINALTAIHHAREMLSRSSATDVEKGLQLRILMHVVADLHQPMHTVSLYSKAFPKGDEGGNRFRLGTNRVADNLHAYWDRGAGFLVQHTRNKRGSLDKKAKRMLKHYPCHIEQMTMNPILWANESFQLAKNNAYRIKPHEKPNRQYQRQARKITEAQLALAGCRLGAMLKMP